jgi:hypothetical protein
MLARQRQYKWLVFLKGPGNGSRSISERERPVENVSEVHLWTYAGIVF